MPVRPLRSEKDYDAALTAITTYFDRQPEPGTTEADEFDLRALAIGNYEAKRWPIARSGPTISTKSSADRRRR